MRMRLMPLIGILLVLQGCSTIRNAFPSKAPSPEPVVVREVEPPRLRYQIKYRRWGYKMVPDFAEIDRSGEYFVVPEAANVP
jgi:hypothetical protein